MARKDDLGAQAVRAEVPKYVDYTLDELAQAINGSRKDFTKWADLRLPPPYLRPSRVFKTVHGYDDGWTLTFDRKNKSDWRGYALGAVLGVLKDISVTSNSEQDLEAGFWRCVPDQARSSEDTLDVETIFTNVECFDQELGKTAAALRQSEPRITGGEPNRELKRAEMMAKVELLDLLRQVFRGQIRLETAFWASVQAMAKFYCDALWLVNKKVQARVPLAGLDLVVLLGMLEHGSLRLCRERGDCGSETWRLYAEADLHAMEESRECHCAMYGKALCIPPAYQVSQNLASPARWPAFRQKCHAPSCSKWFYSKSPRDKVCKGSPKCRKAWQAFLRYLKKCKREDKHPEKHWNDEGMKADFIRDYEPRRT